MRQHGVEIVERDVGVKPLSIAELEALIGARDHKEFLNPRNELYRERGMKEKPPARAEALKLISENPNLMKRPLLVSGKKVLFGFDEKEWKEHLGA